MKNYQIENMSVLINEKKMISNLNLNMQGTQISGIVGPKNSGKTLLLNSLAKDFSMYEIKPKMTASNNNFYALLLSTENLLLKSTAYNNMRILSSQQEKISEEDVKWFLEEVGLEKDDSRTVESYSKIEKTLLAMALLLAENPSIILLDEPYIGFQIADIKLMNQLLKRLKNSDISFIITSENESILQPICEKIYRLNSGQLEKINR